MRLRLIDLLSTAATAITSTPATGSAGSRIEPAAANTLSIANSGYREYSHAIVVRI